MLLVGTCFDWPGYVTKNGYGQLRVNGKTKYAHRYYYELYRGFKVPPGLVICHRCDNRKCINPLHLFIATQKTNMQDAKEKGRIRNQNSYKTHCKSGHLLFGKTGDRQCKICQKQTAMN